MIFPEISIIIPMFNEEKTAEKCVKTLDSYLSQTFKSYEILAVNDGSSDSTARVLSDLEADFPSLRSVGYSTNRGKGSAVRTGILASKGEQIIYTDCDLAYGVDVIKEMASLKKDVVIGSRNLTPKGHEGYTPLRKFASKAYIRLLAVATGFKHTDSQCGIKCYRGDRAREIFSLCKTDGFAFDLEALMIAEKMGLEIIEHGVTIINHSEDASKVRIVRDTFKMLRDIRKIKKYVRTLDLT